VLIANINQLKAWDLRWPAIEKGPWVLGRAGIADALVSKRSAIGIYWAGYSPEGTHATFEPKYCGKAVLQPLYNRLSQHVSHSSNHDIAEHLSPQQRGQKPNVWFRFVEFATPQLAEYVEGVMISAFREEYKWNRRNEWTQHWALEMG
jgi:hypothetical protein